MPRFISACDLYDDWSAFEGISAQFPHLSLVLHLAVAETAAYAIFYDYVLRRLIGRLARRLCDSSDFHKLLCEENEKIGRYLKVELGKCRPDNLAVNNSAKSK